MNELHVCRLRSSDGLDSAELCDGLWHYRAILPECWLTADAGVNVKTLGSCDGSCQSRELSRMIKRSIRKLRNATLRLEDGEVLPSRMTITDEARALLRGSCIGLEQASWYAKRGGEGVSYSLGDVKLVISVRYDWWSGAETGFYQTIEVRTEPCDRLDEFAFSIQPKTADAIAMAVVECRCIESAV